MRYAFIQELEKAYPITVLCKVLEVTRSAYYRYLLKPKNNVAQDVKLIVELKALHKISKQSYGTRRMTKALLDQGYNIGRFKVRRLMRQNGISCKQRRRYTVTTQSKHELVVANNLLNREFNVTRPNEKWVSDITYLWTLEGWLYVAAVLDLFSRRVIGWAISDNMKTDLVENAFEMARRRRQPTAGFLHHSDRGVQYASERYQMLLKKSGAVVSMSRKGNCNWWLYSRNVRNIARNARITYPTGAELTAIKTFINAIVYWDGGASTWLGQRPWLGYKLNEKAVSGVTHYVGDDAVEPVWILIKVLEIIGRDLKKIPPNNIEKSAVDVLMAATNNRNLGVTPYFGGVGGENRT
jgi:transposase InsO family protein